MSNQNMNQSNQDMSIREKGRKFLEELKAKGPRKSNTGKVFVMPSNQQSKETQNSKESPTKNTQEKNKNLSQAIDSSMSPSRKLEKLRIDIMNEFSDLKDQSSKEQQS